VSNTPTPAALALIVAGLSGAELAAELGITRSAVSYQLAGKTAATSSELLEAIERRGGKALADQVAELIAAERVKRSA
jgi:predicted transcriptional regulator